MFTKQVVTRVTPPEDEYLRQRAEREDKSIATVIRALIQDAIKSEQQNHHQAA
jgi:hypothetical protein